MNGPPPMPPGRRPLTTRPGSATTSERGEAPVAQTVQVDPHAQALQPTPPASPAGTQPRPSSAHGDGVRSTTNKMPAVAAAAGDAPTGVTMQIDPPPRTRAHSSVPWRIVVAPEK